MAGKLTEKARQALGCIADGEPRYVSRQMMDRLSSAHLVDFDLRRNGWHLTAAGEEACRTQTQQPSNGGQR